MDYEIKIYFFHEISKRPPQKTTRSEVDFRRTNTHRHPRRIAGRAPFPTFPPFGSRSRTSAAARNGAIRACLCVRSREPARIPCTSDAPRIKTAGSIGRLPRTLSGSIGARIAFRIPHGAIRSVQKLFRRHFLQGTPCHTASNWSAAASTSAGSSVRIPASKLRVVGPFMPSPAPVRFAEPM